MLVIDMRLFHVKHCHVFSQSPGYLFQALSSCRIISTFHAKKMLLLKLLRVSRFVVLLIKLSLEYIYIYK